MPSCVYGVLIKSPPERETLQAGWRADWASAEAGSPSPSGQPTISLRNVHEVALNAPNGASWLENLKSLSRYRRGFEIAGGLTLIAMGLYMLNAVLSWIPQLAM